jgi:hypothetical protein
MTFVHRYAVHDLSSFINFRTPHKWLLQIFIFRMEWYYSVPQVHTIQQSEISHSKVIFNWNCSFYFWILIFLAYNIYCKQIAAKASRQLQEPMVIMTGNLPTWLHETATASLFFVPIRDRSFARDRALQRLMETTLGHVWEGLATEDDCC